MNRISILLLISILSLKLTAQPLESDTVDILKYQINLNIVNLSSKNISGNAVLTLVPKVNSFNRIKLDLLHLDIDSIKVENISKSWTYNDTLIEIGLQTNYSTTDTLEVQVYYHGQPVVDPSGWGGFYFSSDHLYAFNLGVGFDDNPHNYGRVFFPCLDDFHDRAIYEFNITTNSDKMAVCNGLLIGETVDTLNNTKTFKWHLSHSIPTYLASLAVGPYVAVTDTFSGMNGNIPIQIFVPSNKVQSAIGSFARLKQILGAFEYAYGPYRWERVGYVGVPFGSGAMEHATNIAIGLGYINGSNTYESLIAHELSHHWFGDLVTTNSAPEMWLNEGWAVYSENLYKELLDGKDVARNEMRALVKSVIQTAHTQDGGYYSLDSLPHLATYGSTAYDKGATVAHSIRGYLGDSLFFDMLHNYFNQKAFTHISNEEFRDFITSTSGINMNGFFDGWVFQPGFTHFSIDSFSTNQLAGQFYTNVHFKQKLLHKSQPVNDNRVEVRFADDSWHFANRLMEFSGFAGSDTAILNFQPTMAWIDPEGKLADAKASYYKTLHSTGLQTFDDAYFKLNINQIGDSALLFVTHHFVEPDTIGTNLPGLTISSNRYWSVEGIFPQGFSATGQFFYSKTALLDAGIIVSSFDSLVILYRPSPAYPWQSVHFTKQGLWSTGWFHVADLKRGQYAVAVWDEQYAGLNAPTSSKAFSLSPNPSDDLFLLEVNLKKSWTLKVYDSNGRMMSIKHGSGKASLEISKNNLGASGVYYFNLFDSKGELVKSEKAILTN